MEPVESKSVSTEKRKFADLKIASEDSSETEQKKTKFDVEILSPRTIVIGQESQFLLNLSSQSPSKDQPQNEGVILEDFPLSQNEKEQRQNLELSQAQASANANANANQSFLLKQMLLNEEEQMKMSMLLQKKQAEAGGESDAKAFSDTITDVDIDANKNQSDIDDVGLEDVSYRAIIGTESSQKTDYDRNHDIGASTASMKLEGELQTVGESQKLHGNVRKKNAKYYEYIENVVLFNPDLATGNIIKACRLKFQENGVILDDFPPKAALIAKISNFKRKIRKYKEDGRSSELRKFEFKVKGTEVSKQQKDSVSSNETLKTNDAKEADTRQEMDPEIHTKANNDDNPVRENSTQMYSTLSIVDLRCMFMNDQWRFPASVGI